MSLVKLTLHPRKSITAIFIIGGLLLTAAPTQAMQSKIQNTTCSKSGIKKIYNRVALICTKVGSKLIWQPAAIQNLSPIVPKKLATYKPILAFTSLPNSKSNWNDALVGEATAATKEAFDWWEKISNGNLKFATPTILKPVPSSKASVCDPTGIGVDVLKRSTAPKITASTRVITFSLDSKCPSGMAGIAEMRGNYVLIKSSANKSVDNPMEEPFYFNAAVIAHELGHTFGLDHAGSVACETAPGSPKYQINRKCEFSEYGDLADIMGGSSKLYCENEIGDRFPLISNLQRFVALGQLTPTPINRLGTFTINSFNANPAKSLFSINTDYGVAYIEYKPLSESTCAYMATGSRSFTNVDTWTGVDEFMVLKKISKPSIQIRFLGNDQFDPIGKNRSFGLDYITLAIDKERNFSETLSDGRESSISWSGKDINFQLGETIEIPNTKYKLTLTEATESSGTFVIALKD